MIPFYKFTSSPYTTDQPSLAIHRIPDLGIDDPKTESKVVRALIIGAGTVGRELAKQLERDGCRRVVGFADDEIDLPLYEEGVILGRREEVARLVEEYLIDEVYVAYAPSWQQKMVEQLSAYHPEVKLHIVPSPYETMMNLGTVESRGDIALVRLTLGERKIKEFTKRTFDIVAAIIGLILCFPLMALVAGLMKLISPGPIIFAQERVGRYGKPFTLYKFRTMVHNAEALTGPVLAKGKNDPRLTHLGRWMRLFRLDEIPQLFNVLLGQMSLVGPRPERPYFVDKFQKSTPSYARRHHVKPGITGLAQVLGGYHTDARDKLRFDLIYATHQSLWLDLSIIFRTISIVLLPDRYNWGSHK